MEIILAVLVIVMLIIIDKSFHDRFRFATNCEFEGSKSVAFRFVVLITGCLGKGTLQD